MRPKDLKCEFSFADRRPLLKDKVLYVPTYYFRHEAFSMPTLVEIFGNDHPTHIEYCSGHGDWIIQKALDNPQINWIAVEKKFDRVRRIFSKRENRSIKNLLIIYGEAYTATQHYLKEHSFEEAYINFPDPWPKQRHAKHRLIRAEFLQELTRVLVPQGLMTFVTDDAETSTRVIQEVQESPCWKSCYPPPYFVTDRENYGSSFFEKLWKGQGKTIHYLQFQVT
ncbi:MAG: tRNA (guanine(46)-N(7))-methyltransferase TrmB [Chlamydiae bacterium]|nr:tRNA (guanine(46)-N(7))-methyltransferase TrmB [Chlamydiota bacterium]